MSELTLKSKLVGISDNSLLPLAKLISSEIWQFAIPLSSLNQLRSLPVDETQQVNADIDSLFTSGLFGISGEVKKFSGKEIKYHYVAKTASEVLTSSELYKRQLSDYERTDWIRVLLRRFTRTELMYEIATTLTELAKLIQKYFELTRTANSRKSEQDSLYWPIVNYFERMFKNILELEILSEMPGTKQFGSLEITSKFTKILSRQARILRTSTRTDSKLALGEGDKKIIHEVLGMPIFAAVIEAEKSFGCQLDVVQSVPRAFELEVERNINSLVGTSEGRQFLAMSTKYIHLILDQAQEINVRRWSAWEALKEAETHSRPTENLDTRYQQLLKVYHCLYLTCLSLVATGFLLNQAEEEKAPPF